MGNNETPQESSQPEKKSPRELHDDLTALDAKIANLNEIDQKLLNDLLQTFQSNQRSIEKWDAMHRNGKLDPEQEEVFQKLKRDFFGLYNNLIRFHRIQTLLLDKKEYITDEQRRAMNVEKDRLQFDLPSDAVPVSHAGDHGFDSPLLARNVGPYGRYAEFVQHAPAFLRFGTALYPGNTEAYADIQDIAELDSPVFTMIPYAMKDGANDYAKQLYTRYCTEHGLDPEKQVDFLSVKEFGNAGAAEIRDISPRNLTWSVKVYVETVGKGDGLTVRDRRNAKKYYLPPHIIALHEMGHAERIRHFERPPTKKQEMLPDAVREIAQAIDQVIYQDEVYKKVKGLGIDQVVTYDKDLPADKNGNVPLGELANTFRKLKKEHGTIEEALMSDEGRKYVLRHFNN